MNKHLEEDVKVIIEPAEDLKTLRVAKGTNIKIKKKKPPVKVKIEEPIKVKLSLRKTLSGDIIIYDHPLYDVVVMPAKNKIVTFAEKDSPIDPYPSQDKFFNFLAKKGMISPDSIQGGNVFGSLEANYPVNDDVKTIEALILVISDFFTHEIKDIKSAMYYDSAVQELYVEPSEEDSTELGEVPHAKKKGSIDPSRQPYGLIYRI